MALPLVGYEVIGTEAILIGVYGSRVAPRLRVSERIPFYNWIFFRISKYLTLTLQLAVPHKERSMAKRKDDSDNESPHRKRQKITKDLVSKVKIQSVQTSKDLSLLLSFEQDTGPRTRQSIVQRIHVESMILTLG